jgi:hypothetical protein
MVKHYNPPDASIEQILCHFPICSAVSPLMQSYNTGNFSLSLPSRLLQKFDFPSMHFSLYFLGYEDKKEIPADVKERTAWTFSRRATIELTQ